MIRIYSYPICALFIKRYSQQGWEAVNKKAKKAYFTKTAMGGGIKKVGKLLPILQMFMREIFWRFGWADKFFREHMYPREEGDKYCPLDLRGEYARPQDGFQDVKKADLQTIVESLVDLGDYDCGEDEADISLEQVLDELREDDSDEYDRIMSGFEFNPMSDRA